MQFQLETSGHNLITHCGDGRIAVNGRDYTSNLLIAAGAVYENWFEGRAENLSLHDFTPLLELAPKSRPDILILGTGSNHVFPSAALSSGLYAEGMALEVMGTRAACRTYSVLVSEHRSVAAALLQLTS